MSSRPIPIFEVVDDETAAVLRQKTGAERLQIAFGMQRRFRTQVEEQVRVENPTWNEQLVRQQASLRILALGGDLGLEERIWVYSRLISVEKTNDVISAETLPTGEFGRDSHSKKV